MSPEELNKMGMKRKSVNVEKHRFKTQNSIEHNPYNFSRFLKEPELLENKDYKDYANFVGSLKQNKSKNIQFYHFILFEKLIYLDLKNESLQYNDELLVMQNSQRKPFNSRVLENSNNISKKRMNPYVDRRANNYSVQYESKPLSTNYGKFTQRKENSPIRPNLFESRVASNEKFFSLSRGFQKIFVKDKRESDMKIPIAGYAGHRVGYKSSNIFGKAFRKCSIESKSIQKCFNSRPNFK